MRIHSQRMSRSNTPNKACGSRYFSCKNRTQDPSKLLRRDSLDFVDIDDRGGAARYGHNLASMDVESIPLLLSVEELISCEGNV